MAESFDATGPDAIALIDRATDALNAGRPDDALALADEIRRGIGPTADEALIRGIALSQQKQTAAASDAFAEAIRQAPNSHKAHFNAAIHEFNVGNTAGALQLARSAATLDPEHGGTRELLDRLREVSSPPRMEPEVRAEPEVQSAPAAAPRPPSASAASGESLPWIAKLGAGWIAIAFVLFAFGIAAMVLQVKMMPSSLTSSTSPGSFSELFSKAMESAQKNQNHPLFVPTAICGNISLFGTIVWVLLDLIRRAGNFVWLVAVIPLSCLGLTWIALPLYLFVGRKSRPADDMGT